jgi:hypothetical protein
MRKPGRGALCHFSSEQGIPRGVERTTWLGGGGGGVHCGNRHAVLPSENKVGLLGVVRDLLLPHLALLQEAGGYHQCFVRVRERIAPNAGSARILLM